VWQLSNHSLPKSWVPHSDDPPPPPKRNKTTKPITRKGGGEEEGGGGGGEETVSTKLSVATQKPEGRKICKQMRVERRTRRGG